MEAVGRFSIRPITSDDLTRFLTGLDKPAIIQAVVDASELTTEEAGSLLDTYLNESHVALDLIIGHLRPGLRILEVGAGLGAFALFLHSHGYQVIALEPVSEAFDFIGVAGQAIRAQHADFPPVLARPVANLGRSAGQFDLVFSVNVLEHLPDVAEGLTAIDHALTPTGVQVHTCPNYRIPYEPHVGLLLVPVFPASTARLWARSEADTAIWRSLNWVTAGQVRRWARRHDRRLVFRSGMMAAALDRRANDSVFALRHQSLLVRIAASRPVSVVLSRLPAGLSTPMSFTIRRRG